MDVKWIKIVTDIFDDEKILLIESLPESDSIIVIWFKLLCLAGKTNSSGVLLINEKIPYTEEMLSTIFRRKLNTVRLALETFKNLGMIEIINNTITIPNWGKHQSMDALEKKREYQRNYMATYRKKQEELTLQNANCKTNCESNSKTNVRQIDIEEEVDIDKNKNKEVVEEIGDGGLLRKIINTLQENLHIAINPFVTEQVNYWVKAYSLELIYEAIKRAALSDKRTVRYIDGILLDWETHGYKTLESVNNFDQINKPKPFKRGIVVPEAKFIANVEMKPEIPDDEPVDIEELKKTLKSFKEE